MPISQATSRRSRSSGSPRLRGGPQPLVETLGGRAGPGLAEHAQVVVAETAAHDQHPLVAQGCEGPARWRRAWPGSSPATRESWATGIFASGSATIMGTNVPWSYPRSSSRPGGESRAAQQLVHAPRDVGRAGSRPAQVVRVVGKAVVVVEHARERCRSALWGPALPMRRHDEQGLRALPCQLPDLLEVPDERRPRRAAAEIFHHERPGPAAVGDVVRGQPFRVAVHGEKIPRGCRGSERRDLSWTGHPRRGSVAP